MAETQELTEEDVFANDIDPLDGIRELRKQEGVKEEDLIPADASSDVVPDDKQDDKKDGDDELEAFQDTPDDSKKDEESTDQTQDTVPDTGDQGQETSNEDKTDGGELQDTETEKTDTQEEVTAPTKRKFKANGQEFEFTEDEIMEQFETVFGQAMNYTQKMQAIAPFRKMISALEEEGITQDQLNMAIDALKGDKGALQQILAANKIEAFDLESQEETDPYKPTDYGKNEAQLNIDEITSSISKDPEYKITVDVVDNQWDSTSRQALAKNPQFIVGLHNDIKSGLFDKVSPVAMKMKVLDGNTRSDIEYYMLAGEQLQIQEQEQGQNAQQKVDELNQQTQDAVDNADQASSEAQQKRAASSTRTRADRKGVIDYLDDDDEKFDEWYNNLMSNN